MRDGQTERRGHLAGQRDDLRDLLGCEPGRHAASVVVAKDAEDERLEFVVVHGLRFRAREHVHRRCPTSTPPSDTLGVDAERIRLVDAEFAIGGAQDDAGALSESLLGRGRPNDAPQNGALAWQEHDDWCVLRHPTRMIRPIRECNRSQPQPACARYRYR